MDADGKSVRKVFAKIGKQTPSDMVTRRKDRLLYLRPDEWTIYIATIDGKTV